MIRKSVQRFSEKIMLNPEGSGTGQSGSKAAE